MRLGPQRCLFHSRSCLLILLLTFVSSGSGVGGRDGIDGIEISESTARDDSTEIHRSGKGVKLDSSGPGVRES